MKSVPPEVLRAVAARRPQHKPEQLAKSREELIAEVFRICADRELTALSEEYFGPEDYSAWFFRPDGRITKSAFEKSLEQNMHKASTDAAAKHIGEEPKCHLCGRAPPAACQKNPQCVRK